MSAAGLPLAPVDDWTGTPPLHCPTCSDHLVRNLDDLWWCLRCTCAIYRARPILARTPAPPAPTVATLVYRANDGWRLLLSEAGHTYGEIDLGVHGPECQGWAASNARALGYEPVNP